MPNGTSDDKRLDFLRDEYLLLQNQYEDYDKRSLTIKSWISTGAIAGLAISFGDSLKFAEFVPAIIFVIVLAV